MNEFFLNATDMGMKTMPIIVYATLKTIIAAIETL
jgi:hypothetical protein